MVGGVWKGCCLYFYGFSLWIWFIEGDYGLEVYGLGVYVLGGKNGNKFFSC